MRGAAQRRRDESAALSGSNLMGQRVELLLHAKSMTGWTPTGVKVTGTVSWTFHRRRSDVNRAEPWLLIEEDGTGQVFEGAVMGSRLFRRRRRAESMRRCRNPHSGSQR